MKKKLIVLMLSMSMTAALVSGCGSTAETAVESTATETVQETATEAETADAESDQEAADKVAALIDQIYVQERNDNTDEQCAEAKAAWDALTDAQKELVEGENADPDYFGRDTGDASKDDPLNADEIGENELLVVSFGTSFNDSRAEDIGGIEKALQKAYPDWSVRRAFTAQIIINHVQARDGEKIDNMDQALQRAVDNGVKNLIVQPTHLMHGAEYDELSEAVASYSDKFESVSIAEPLLGEVGSADDSVNSDKEAVAKAVTAEAVKTAGYESLDAAKEDGTAFVFMGHGTSHTAKISYSQMQNQMNALGYDNVFIGTVEGEPEDTACEAVIEKIQEAGYKKVILRPLMVVAGDHANNDMAGDDDDSWKSQFEASGVFDSIETQIAGLGQIPVIQDLYVSHTHAAMEELGTSAASNSDTTDAVLEDGTYEAEFKTDSGMFHVNEANDGKGVLTVKDGQMSIHISLTSKNIVNLFVGKAADAKKDGAELLQPTTDTVTYDDGTTEEVNGFDVPVKALDKDSVIRDLNKVYFENRGFLTDYHLMQNELFTEEEQTEFPAKRLDISARYQGVKISFASLLLHLEEDITELENLIKDGDRELFEDILANTVSRKIRGKINSSNTWVQKMNSLMNGMNTSSGLKLSLRWRSKTAEQEDQLDTKELVELLKKDYRLMSEDEAARLSAHFRSKVAEARRNAKDSAGMVSFYQIMKDTLDYRKWFEFQLFSQKNGERQKELTNSVFGTFSGGEKAMSMYVPLFSAVVAKYQGGREDAPRLISLDEAFAGVDNKNIRDMFRLMTEFQFDFIINSQVLWGDCDTLDALAIYQLIRPGNAKFVTVMPYLWNGHRKELLEHEEEVEQRGIELGQAEGV